ncbi:MAG: TIM barrel protein [bacterium]|nr:sugar phosphate isomerase/epimerase [Acidimicrobiia bacterium]MCY4649032.1 TIM barrel protein [bacterium]
MKNRYSCADYGWPSLQHRTVMAVASDLGYSGIDIGIFEEVTHTKVSDLKHWREKSARINRDLNNMGLQCADVFLVPSVDLSCLTASHPDPQMQSEAIRIFEIAALFARRLKAPGLTICPGVVHEGDTHQQALLRTSKALRARVEIASFNGLELSVEPHWGSLIDTAERVGDLLDAVDGLSLTLDVSMMFFCGMSVEEIASFASRTRHIQFRPGSRDKVQVRLKHNQIDFAPILSALDQASYQGWLGTEYVWMEKWGCDQIDVTEESRQLLKSLKGEDLPSML